MMFGRSPHFKKFCKECGNLTQIQKPLIVTKDLNIHLVAASILSKASLNKKSLNQVYFP